MNKLFFATFFGSLVLANSVQAMEQPPQLEQIGEQDLDRLNVYLERAQQNLQNLQRSQFRPIVHRAEHPMRQALRRGDGFVRVKQAPAQRIGWIWQISQ